MSKEFEEWKQKVGVESNKFTMRNCFAAGRALGRREMKGEAGKIMAEELEKQQEIESVKRGSRQSDFAFGAVCSLQRVVVDIEAIPEEV